VVTSAGYHFTTVDVGHTIQVKAGSGWTPGGYKIVAASNNAATLDRSPAGGGSKDASWGEDLYGSALVLFGPESDDLSAALKSWGESDISSVTPPKTPTFDKDAGDLPSPLWGGAIAERPGKGRLVVIGAASFIDNGMLNFPDPKLRARSKVDVARFPGNGELFTNSVFWLAGQEKMI